MERAPITREAATRLAENPCPGFMGVDLKAHGLGHSTRRNPGAYGDQEFHYSVARLGWEGLCPEINIAVIFGVSLSPLAKLTAPALK